MAPTDLANTEMDGFTVVLTCEAPVQPGEVNSIRLAIADASDDILDSWIFVRAESITTIPPNCGNGIVEEGQECDDGDLNGTTCCALDCTWSEEGDACGGGAGLCVTEEDGDPPVMCECPEDQGYTLDPDTLECTTTCGDGIVAGDQECDWGADNGTTECGCQADCTLPVAGTFCNGSPVGECDLQNYCDGEGLCVDAFVDDGTPCTSDGLFCTGEEACLAGACVSPGDPCDPLTEICSEDQQICLDRVDIAIVTPEDGDTLENARPVISGTATPHADIEIYIDGDLVGSTTADENGHWSVELDEDLDDGEHTVTAVAIADDFVSEDQVTFTVETEPLPPILPNLDVTYPQDGDTVEPDGVVVTGTADPGVAIDVFLDGELVGTNTADEDGNWSVPLDDDLPEGERELVVTATDDDGNSSQVDLTFFVEEEEQQQQEEQEEQEEYPERELSGGGIACAATSSPDPSIGTALLLLGLIALRRRRAER